MGRPFTLKSPRRQVEADGQKHVVKLLRYYLPAEVWWTASLSGIRLPMHTAVEAKAMGMERGATDLSFILPDKITRYIDMKTTEGVLTREQKIVRALVGEENFAVCIVYPLNLERTWLEVRAALTGWMAPLGLEWLGEREALQRARLRALADKTRQGIAA